MNKCSNSSTGGTHTRVKSARMGNHMYKNKIAFDPRLKEPCWACGKRMLIMAQPGQSLKCLGCGSPIADPLCWFCKHSKDPRIHNCQLTKKSGWIKFCKDFTPTISSKKDKPKPRNTNQQNALIEDKP